KALAALMGLTLMTASGAAAEPHRRDYQATPFWVAEPYIPQVLLILSKDYKMFYQAYAGLIVDIDGDGRIDTGFNPAAEYIGYFDSRSCYAYKAGHEGKETYNNRWFAADPAGYFLRVGPTVDDEATPTRPAGLKGYIPSPRSVAGICDGRTFSGNWLNFMTSSRMDVIRKILYGGDRVVDSEKETYLEASFVPPDAAVWGTDIMADDIWNNTPYNAYYDIRKYAPFSKPANGRAHYFARVRDTAEGALFPALRMAENVQIGTTERRYWDWVMQDRPVPNDNYIHSYVDKYKSYRVKVKVCDSSGNLENEAYGCRRYPGGAYKPVGLLQKYGENDKMYFGLMTGGFSETMRTKGGVMRNHIDSLETSIDSSTGQLLPHGLPWSISQLRISGRNLKTYDPTASCAYNGCLYADYNSWGNPLGEMLYEGVRYLSGRTAPTSAFSSGETGDRSETFFGAARANGKSPINNLLDRNSLKSWSSRPALLAGNCPKPVILLISDIDSSYDGDDIPNNNDLNKAELMPGIAAAGQANLPQQFSMNKYLEEITRNEGYGGGKYAIAKKRADDCSAKTMKSLSEVKGICPQGPSYEGTYSLAAAAYYAHTHNFNPGGGAKTAIDVYAVTMSAAFPELTFNMPDGLGKPDPSRKISILPVNITSLNNHTPYFVQNTERILSYINYFLYDWQLDKNGLPFSITIRVNFSDRSMADDWEMDVVQEYKVNLLTTAATAGRSVCSIAREGANCGVNIANIISGEFRSNPADYYYFKNPDTADKKSDFIEIKPREVAGLSVESRFILNGSGGPLGIGYTILGSKHDGTYIENSLEKGREIWATPASPYNTPPTCPWTGASGNGCGSPHKNTRQIRTFKFAENTNIKNLPNPMWLAAKYGGFKDQDHNGIPNADSEWKRGGGGPGKDDPLNYFQAVNISDLAVQLGEAFQAIADSAVTGTANSASINTILGGGLSIQTQYHTAYKDPTDSNVTVRWAGSVYALFVDKWGNLREDTNGNGKLDLVTSPPGVAPDREIGDRIVVFRTVEGQSLPEIILYRDERGNNNPTDPRPVASFEQLKTVWSVSDELAKLTAAQVKASRGYDDAVPGRRVYSYYGGQPADGSAAWPATGVDLGGYLFNEARAAVLRPFMRQSDVNEARDLINYVLGLDQPKYRNRTVKMTSLPGPARTWRLGDVMNSKPIIVGEPAGNFHLLYGDKAFAEYKSLRARRRQVAYFGANDGLLHAVNLGFYGSLKSGQAGYAKQAEISDAAFPLGAELWGYIPTAILPHLQWLADPAYNHGYYVDMKPYIVDVKDDRKSVDAEKWRTVMIVGLRLGGRSINMSPDNDPAPKISYSEFFALDITDPSREPALLWRFSHQNLGLSTASPTVVRSKGSWYVILASGPTSDVMEGGRMMPKPAVGETNAAYEGVSTQRARLFILDALTGKLVRQAAPNPDDDKLAVKEENSFFNDAFTPRAAYIDKKIGGETTWSNHVVYVGLTAKKRVGGRVDDVGALYRLKMADEKGAPLDVDKWELTRLFKTDRPVTGAVNSAYDPLGNLWVVFGSGRIWSKADLNPCGLNEAAVTTACGDNHGQYLFGIKEPLNEGGKMTFAEVPNDGGIADVSGIKVFDDGRLKYPGVNLFGANITTHASLHALMLKRGAGAYNGYKRKMETWKVIKGGQNPGKTVYEIIVTQPKIDRLPNGRSNTIFTSYLTSKNVCDPAGQSYLNVADTFTGLPAPYMKDYGFIEGLSEAAGGGQPPALEVTGAKSSGQGMASEAWILKTGEGTVYGNTGANSARNTMFLPLDQSDASSVVSWREVLDMGFDM
ncbi:MAG: hypothetical protein LBS31_00835, partial [Candidatus Adiutrix sp.]|nr:hypothetical protein [Candidatus Adiutrix sp.]